MGKDGNKISFGGTGDIIGDVGRNPLLSNSLEASLKFYGPVQEEMQNSGILTLY